MKDIDTASLTAAAGIGVAGNFAGHLEQAGEAVDFAHVRAASSQAPKGIFPWYVPGVDTFLGTYPLSSERIDVPRDLRDARLQIEPEIGVVCRVEYDAAGKVAHLTPECAAAFNDCSIRRDGATRISEKKNWGPSSKGIAASGFALSDIDAAGGLRRLRIASFLRRNGRVDEYGIDSAAADYSYCGAQLIDWICDRLRTQVAAPQTPLEDVGALLRLGGCPQAAVIGIGATRYSEVGESTFLDDGDQSIVVVYDHEHCGRSDVLRAVDAGTETKLAGASVVSQRVVRTER